MILEAMREKLKRRKVMTKLKRQVTKMNLSIMKGDHKSHDQERADLDLIRRSEDDLTLGTPMKWPREKRSEDHLKKGKIERSLRSQRKIKREKILNLLRNHHHCQLNMTMRRNLNDCILIINASLIQNLKINVNLNKYFMFCFYDKDF